MKNFQSVSARGDVLSFSGCQAPVAPVLTQALLLLSYVVPVNGKLEISQNFEAFSEYMNFNSEWVEAIMYQQLFFSNPDGSLLVIYLLL